MKRAKSSPADLARARSRQAAVRRSLRTVALGAMGHRVGTKKRDMRWQSPDGVIWGSRFEYEAYLDLKNQGVNVRKTTEEDTFEYAEHIGSGRCLSCGSTSVIKPRTYTPDIVANPDRPDRRYYVEAKGYLRAESRSLIRAFHNSRPDVPLRFIIQRDYRVSTTLSFVQWIERYLKGVKVHVYGHKLPEDWK